MRRSLLCAFDKVSILSVPMNLGQPNKGLDVAPMKLIGAGLVDLLTNIGWKSEVCPALTTTVLPTGDHVDIEHGKTKNCAQVGAVCQQISKYVAKECSPKTFPLILGGDHCISIGSIHGIATQRKNTGVVWVDAHADINTPTSSLSGNMHGMPVAFLAGLVPSHSTLPGFEWFSPVLSPKDFCYIGLRDLDIAEKKLIRSLGMKAFTMADVDRLGIGKVMEQCCDYMAGKSIHLSFDIDGIDPFFAPHTGTAAHGGLTYREGAFICEELFSSGNLTSMELVEVDPERHPGVDATKTINTALTLIAGAMGRQIL